NRDELNKTVQQVKELREQARADRREKHHQILKLKEKLKQLSEKKPRRSINDLENEIKKIEWTIQTTSLPIREEKNLIDDVRTLETQLLTSKKIRRLEENLLELQAEEKALETKARIHHERLSQLALQSQNFHEKMSGPLREIQSLRPEAEGAHQKYVEIKQKTQPLHQKRAELLRAAKSLKQKLRQAEEEKQLKRQRELQNQVVEKALEKLKRGEKLSWEEFKILTKEKKVKRLKTTLED
ncbi:MAG: hypothetical protein JSV29_03890, partial [Candidatus Bathyarchaeota archaeon]